MDFCCLILYFPLTFFLLDSFSFSFLPFIPLIKISLLLFFPTAYLVFIKTSIISNSPIFPFVISMSFSFLPSLEGHSNSFQQYLICILELFVPMAISNISVLPISTLWQTGVCFISSCILGQGGHTEVFEFLLMNQGRTWSLVNICG